MPTTGDRRSHRHGPEMDMKGKRGQCVAVHIAFLGSVAEEVSVTHAPIVTLDVTAAAAAFPEARGTA
jgi:hypothetical protein